MATPVSLDNDALNSALKYIWSQYRTWALTSRKYKNEVSRWRDIVLALSIGGAILGTLSQQLTVWNLGGPSSWWSRSVGFISGAALGLAAYFAKEIFSPDPEGKAVRARAAAEAFKSDAYLLAAGVPPYDTAATTEELFAKTEQVKKGVASLAPVTITVEEKIDRMPSIPMSIDDYIKQRVDDQIGYYSRAAAANSKKVAVGRRLSFILGAVAVVLGLVSATYASVAGWVAVIGTITAAIAARQYSGRYQFLIVSYHAVAEKLEWLKTRWEIERKTQGGTAPHHKFILACEEAISTENSAWMAEWTKKDKA
jgi:SMODS and SLOG-associating 2TM effector domain 1